jgi:hypothetical protein
MKRVAHAVSVTLNGATRWRLSVLVAFDGQLRVSFLVVSRLERYWTVAATENNADTPTRRHADTPTRRHADTSLGAWRRYLLGTEIERAERRR